MPISRTPSTLRAILDKAQARLNNAALKARETLKDAAPVPSPCRKRFDPKVAEMLKLPPENVFRHLDRLAIPSVAYVAGAGPLLLDELDMIPRNAWVIACNRAIMAPFPFKLWMVFDINAPKYAWFKNPPPGDYERVYGNALRKLYPGTMWFSSRRTESPFSVAPGGLQGGGTIVGCALQLLYWAGCQTVIMLGAPMSGRYHFDGTTACGYCGTWKQAHRCRSFVDQMVLGGMTTLALHANAMNLPIFEVKP